MTEEGSERSEVAGQSVAAALRLAYPQTLAHLVRWIGSFDQAEDLMQEAASRAWQHWKKTGVPDSPAAWLLRTAKNQAIDGFRRNELHKRYENSEEKNSQSLSSNSASNLSDSEELGLRDDMLRLIFVCCHPVLKTESQVALTLKAVGGLSVEEIARAFLVPSKTMEQRLTRAKRKISDARVVYEVPGAKELPDRLSAVLAVVHLIFNEGHSASVDAPIIRHDLCRMAIRQAHLLHRLFLGDAEVEGLLALLLLTHARSPARLDDHGELVPLDQQDRSQWNREAINEGLALLDSALRRGRAGTYQIQAAISAMHCKAAAWEQTDWVEILRLYDALILIRPSPVVRLNRSVALARVHGPAVALEELDELKKEAMLERRHSIHAVAGALYEEMGEAEGAVAAYESAFERTDNQSEGCYFQRKIAELKKGKK